MSNSPLWAQTRDVPTLTPLQRDIIRHPANRKVIVAGRRAGKTTLAAYLALERFFAGQRVLLTSATQDQADTFWDKLKAWLYPLIEDRIVGKLESRRLLTLNALDGPGGRIRVKTGRHPDVLRGDDADLIVFDECALLDPAVWNAVAAPMLADRDGDAVFISTPRAKNWFFHLYQRGLDPQQPRWAAWHFTTHDNPHLSRTAVAALEHDMPRYLYKQEILAEFVDNATTVFRDVRHRPRQPASSPPATPNPQRYVAGLDWARQHDYTVMTVLDMHTRHVVAMERFNLLGWAQQRARVERLHALWRPEAIIAEANSIGGPNIEALQASGLPVRPFVTTAQSKRDIIEHLVLALEHGDLTLLDDAVLLGELEAYEMHIDPVTRHIRYNAPSGGHDDTVIALALAWHGYLDRHRRKMAVSSNPFYG
jgi:hypothetical protein